MRAFEPVSEGWSSALEPWEREAVVDMLSQVEDLLLSDAARAPSPAPLYTGSRVGESPRDHEILVSLDFAVQEPTGPARPTGPAGRHQAGGRDTAPTGPAPLTPAEAPGSAGTACGHDGATSCHDGPGNGVGDGDGSPFPPRLPALEALLPDASEDPDLAVDVASVTRDRLRAMKTERIGAVLAELQEPSGRDGAVLVRRGEEGAWLGALNDTRLVLATFLGIRSARDAERVHALAWHGVPAAKGTRAHGRRVAALSYEMLTWWQESLLCVLLGRSPGA